MSCGSTARARLVYHELLLTTISIHPGWRAGCRHWPLMTSGTSWPTGITQTFKSDSWARRTLVLQSDSPPPLGAFIIWLTLPISTRWLLWSFSVIHCLSQYSLLIMRSPTLSCWDIGNYQQMPVYIVYGRFPDHTLLFQPEWWATGFVLGWFGYVGSICVILDSVQHNDPRSHLDWFYISWLTDHHHHGPENLHSGFPPL